MIPLTADGMEAVAIMAVTGSSERCSGLRPEAFMAKAWSACAARTRPSGKAQLESAFVDKVVFAEQIDPGQACMRAAMPSDRAAARIEDGCPKSAVFLPLRYTSPGLREELRVTPLLEKLTRTAPDQAAR